MVSHDLFLIIILMFKVLKDQDAETYQQESVRKAPSFVAQMGALYGESNNSYFVDD